jgi:hypothetical protein
LRIVADEMEEKIQHPVEVFDEGLASEMGVLEPLTTCLARAASRAKWRQAVGYQARDQPLDDD